MGKLGWVALILFLAVVVVILIRLPEDALTLAIGVLLGILATVPLVFAWALSRRWAPPSEQPKREQQYPPVVVIQGGQQVPQLGPPPSLPLPGAQGERHYEVVGDYPQEERTWREGE